MNINTARQIHNHVAHIAELATTFYAHYGSNYRLSDDSPQAAWDLYHAFMDEQRAIASLLDPKAAAKPYMRWESWWDVRDVMNIGLVNELASEALRLVEHVAFLVANGQDVSCTRSACTIQESIAGLLHPEALRQVAVTAGTPLGEAV